MHTPLSGSLVFPAGLPLDCNFAKLIAIVSHTSA